MTELWNAGWEDAPDGYEPDAEELDVMVALVRRAMQNDFEGFEVLFQPLIDARGGDMCGAEALLRMYDGRKMILPGEFLPAAERAGLMGAVDEFVLRTAAQQCHKINDMGFPDFMISVNLSGSHLERDGLASDIRNIIQISGVKPQNILVSFSEDSVAQQAGALDTFAGQAAGVGFSVGLDDYGGGAADVASLPVDVLNISSRYMAQMEKEPARMFIRQTVKECRAAGKRVCVSGVESNHHYQFCVEAGADYIQGFYMFVPGDAHCLEQLL